MRGFFRSNTFKIMIMVVLIMLAILSLSTAVGSATVVSLFGLSTSPMGEVVVEATSQQKDELAELTREQLEIYAIELEAQNQEFREMLVDYYDIKEENAQYEETLNLRDKMPELEVVPASVTARDPSQINTEFSINLGSVDGVSEGDTVITSAGLVGVIKEVYSLSSRVSTILSEDINVGAAVESVGESGVVKGDAEASINGLVKFDYLTKNTQVQIGDLITTTGSGGNFPEGIIIGEVAYMGTSDEDVSLYAMVEPIEDIRTISSVFVITNFDGKGEIEEISDEEDGEEE